MKPVETSVVINQTLAACFAYLSDLGNDVEWRREWVEAAKTTDGPMAWSVLVRGTDQPGAETSNKTAPCRALRPAWTQVILAV
jgi:hypothetical protein